MARKLKSDRVLFMATLLLVCASIVMVYSASAVWSFERYNDAYRFVTRQALWACLGVSVLAISMRVDYRLYKTDLFAWSLIGLVGIMLMVVLFGADVKGSRRWFGVAGLGVQPSELAKVACVVFTALILERRMHRIDEVGYSLLPIGIVVGAIAGLIMRQPDFGTAVSLLLVVGVMIFSAGLSYRYVAGALAAMVPAMYLVMILAPYRVKRFTAFLDPFADPLHSGYQAIQSMIAVSTGGLFGKGLTQGVQKLFYLPEPHNDFIYAVISEELGLVGATAVLICFCVIAWRGLRIALRSEDAFAALMAVGLTTMICAQAFINISVVLSLLPTKGIPLPLVSAGGSSLLISLLGIGMLLNISQHEVAEA